MAGPWAAASANDWISYGGDPGGMRYSAHDQIHRENVGELQLAWTYRTGEASLVPDRAVCLPQPPCYAVADARRSRLFADFLHGLQPHCCAGPDHRAWNAGFSTPRSNWKPSVSTSAEVYRYGGTPGPPTARAVSGGCIPTPAIGVCSPLMRSTGKVCQEFGRGGQVDINPLIAATRPKGDIRAVQFWAPPAVVGDVVVTSATVHSKNNLVASYPGVVRGFHARTGELLWTFDVVPRNPEDPLHGEWTQEGLAVTGGGSPWSYLSVDEKKDLVFLPTSSASPDYFGGTRPGR